MADTHPTVIQFLDAWKALDEDAYTAMFAERFESIDPYGIATTIEGVRQHIVLIRKYWTDLEYEITDSFGDDQRVAVAYRIRMLGTGGGWEGQRLEVDCLALVDVENGKIARWRESFDTNKFLSARKAAA